MIRDGYMGARDHALPPNGRWGGDGVGEIGVPPIISEQGAKKIIFVEPKAPG